jgi:hypothetical protein
VRSSRWCSRAATPRDSLLISMDAVALNPADPGCRRRPARDSGRECQHPVAPSALDQRVVEDGLVVVLASDHDELVSDARIDDPLAVDLRAKAFGVDRGKGITGAIHAPSSVAAADDRRAPPSQTERVAGFGGAPAYAARADGRLSVGLRLIQLVRLAGTEPVLADRPGVRRTWRRVLRGRRRRSVVPVTPQRRASRRPLSVLGGV